MPSLVGIVKKNIYIYYALFKVLRWEFASVYFISTPCFGFIIYTAAFMSKNKTKTKTTTLNLY